MRKSKSTNGGNLLDFYIKYQWYILGGFVLLLIGSLFLFIKIRSRAMSYLEGKDTKKEYFPEKIWQEINQREDDNGNFYYGIYFWEWQVNKLEMMYDMFPIGEYFTDKLIVTDAVIYNTLVDKFSGQGKRQSYYKREFRIYYKIAEERKAVVNNFNHNGIGNQFNTVNQINHTVNNTINQLEELLNEDRIVPQDKQYIENFIYHLSKDKVTEKDKSDIIGTLSKYTSLGSNVIAIIANLTRIFM